MIKKVFLASVITAGVVGGIYFLQKSDPKEEPKKPISNTTASPVSTSNEVKPEINTEKPEANDNRDKIVNLLKLVGLAQSAWSQENGSYSTSLEKLHSPQSQQLKDLISSQKKKKEYLGYLFTDILDDKDSDDTRDHFGLLASPANDNAGKFYLLIMDQNLQEAFGEKKDSNKETGEIQFYESVESKNNLKGWPSNVDLSKWTRIKPNVVQDSKKKLNP